MISLAILAAAVAAILSAGIEDEPIRVDPITGSRFTF